MSLLDRVRELGPDEETVKAEFAAHEARHRKATIQRLQAQLQVDEERLALCRVPYELRLQSTKASLTALGVQVRDSCMQERIYEHVREGYYDDIGHLRVEISSEGVLTVQRDGQEVLRGEYAFIPLAELSALRTELNDLKKRDKS